MGMVVIISRRNDRDSDMRSPVTNIDFQQLQRLTALPPSKATFRSKQLVCCFGHASLHKTRSPQDQRKYPPEACASRKYSGNFKPQHFLAKGLFVRPFQVSRWFCPSEV